MKVKSIKFPKEWENNLGIENQSMDIFLEVENGYIYDVVVGTPQYIEYLMDKNQKNYFEPGIPFIIVKELTKEIIEETIKAYAEKNNGYWLKSHHFAKEIDESVFDKLKAEKIEDNIEYEKEYGTFDKLYDSFDF